MGEGKILAVIILVCAAMLVGLGWVLLKADERQEVQREWDRQVHRRAVETCFNRGGIPTFDKWTGAVDNCVAVPK